MIHNFNPVLFNIGPLAIRWYSLAYIAGIIFGLAYMKFLADKSRLKLPAEFFDKLFCAIVIGVIIGGRLGHVLFYNPLEYFQNPVEIFKTWNGGMSFHGGTIGALIGIILVAKNYKINFWKILDLAACASPIGIFFGRLANFINGELFGKATQLPWGVIFFNTGGGQIARHPTQIYEALAEGLLVFILLNFLFFKYKSYKKPSHLSALFGIFYSIFRFAIEFFKMPDLSSGYILNYFTMGHLLSIIMILAGIFLLSIVPSSTSKRSA